MDPRKIMEAVARRRTVFHSEADFQHAFAWELHRAEPTWDIRLEVPVRTDSGAIHLDLLARSKNGQIAVELKYKTRALALDIDGEPFALMNHGAQDLGRYDFFKDLSRVEAFTKSGPDRRGYAIFLTNDGYYWRPPRMVGAGYAAFAMNEGREVCGSLCWGDRASAGTRQGRANEIGIYGRYRLSWLPYSKVPANAHGEFRYLSLEVSGPVQE
jgi:hypothetical protein